MVSEVLKIDTISPDLNMKISSYQTMLFIWGACHAAPAVFFDRSFSQVIIGETEIQWAETLHKIHLPMNLTYSQIPTCPTPTTGDPIDYQSTGLATAINKFSESIDRNNEVNARKGKEDGETNTMKQWNELDSIVKELILNAGSESGTSPLEEPPQSVVDLLSK